MAAAFLKKNKAVLQESWFLLKNAIRYPVFTYRQVECVVSADVSPLLENGRFLTCGMPFIPEEGNNTLTCHIFIPPSYRSAKYTDGTSDTHSSFGFILLESAFHFPLSFLLSTVRLHCLSYNVIRNFFFPELFLSYISQFIHTGWISYSLEKGWVYWHKIILGPSDWLWTGRLGIWMEILLWEDLGSHCNSESSIFSLLPWQTTLLCARKIPCYQQRFTSSLLGAGLLTYHLIYAVESSVQRW